MGLFTIVMLIVAAHQSVVAAIFLGALAFVLLGLLFNWLFCAKLPDPAVRDTAVPGSAGGMGTLVADEVKPGATVSETQTARAEVAKQAEQADATAAEFEAEASVGDSDAAPAPAAEPETVKPDSGSGSVIKPSKALSGQDDLASRKGSWRYEGDGSKAEETDAGTEAAAPVAEDRPSDDAPRADASADAPADDATDAPDASAGKADAAPAETSEPEVGAGLKPSKPLAGEADLASRKGSWKYEGGGGTSAAATTGDTSEDFDKDGKLEGTEEGEKPSMMDAPREGGPDNLKEIKGIGPKLEKLCHSMGIYHFDQIAAWTDQEIAWVNANLVGFKGRVTRDDWVGQAKILMTGAETEFSQRVEDGKVY